jgi:hypothetical protein
MAEGEGSWRTCFSVVIKRLRSLFPIRMTDSEKCRRTILERELTLVFVYSLEGQPAAHGAQARVAAPPQYPVPVLCGKIDNCGIKQPTLPRRFCPPAPIRSDRS